MTDTAISVSNLGKCYEIYNNPRDRLKQFVVPNLQRLAGRPLHKQYFREFWALRDVSFEIRKGETLGIIGRNGSGKSTLLQLICGTLNATTGSIQTNGRVSALLELGSGFNPEFTGRENVYMNASILGLPNAEIDARYDDIVSFADIGEFIDQPVKTYSSGMLVRLAFSVATQVDPEILIIDEALSVGDTFFQAKCMLKMRKMINNEGTTLLFVSHSMDTVKSICKNTILLNNGQMLMNGNSSDVVQKYFNIKVGTEQIITENKEISEIENKHQGKTDYALTKFISPSDAFKEKSSFQRINNGMAEFLNIILLDENENEVTTVSFGQRVTLRMALRANVDIPVLGHGYHIRNRNGVDVIYGSASIEDKRLYDLKSGDIHIIDWTFKLNLLEGFYTIACVTSIPIDIEIGNVEFCDFIPIAYQFEMERRFPAKAYGLVYLDNDVKMYKLNNE